MLSLSQSLGPWFFHRLQYLFIVYLLFCSIHLYFVWSTVWIAIFTLCWVLSGFSKAFFTEAKHFVNFFLMTRCLVELYMCIYTISTTCCRFLVFWTQDCVAQSKLPVVRIALTPFAWNGFCESKWQSHHQSRMFTFFKTYSMFRQFFLGFSMNSSTRLEK